MWLEQFIFWSTITTKSFSLVMKPNILRFWSFKSSMVYKFDISFSKCILLHFDVLNFKFHFLDHSIFDEFVDIILKFMKLWSCRYYFVSWENKKNAFMSFGKSLSWIIKCYDPNWVPWSTPLITFSPFTGWSQHHNWN